jgi:fatty acid desaturase
MPHVEPRTSQVNILFDRQLLKTLGEPAPGRLLLQTAAEWLAIVALVLAAQAIPNVLFRALCVLLIATRQHALLALMHEYAHFQLSRRRQWLNDLVGDVLTAFPFFITVHGFRRNHMPHHRHVSTERDPNWMSSLRKPRYRFPMTRGRMLAEVLKHTLGWYTLEELKGYTVDSGMAVGLPRRTWWSRFVFFGLLAAVATWLHLWSTILSYWIVPMATFLMAILYIRDVGEHFGMPSAGIANSRTVVAGWLERLLICQNGVNYHAEHHLFPAVPFFRLGRLHRTLMADATYRDHAVVTRGYFSGLVAEATTRRA